MDDDFDDFLNSLSSPATISNSIAPTSTSQGLNTFTSSGKPSSSLEDDEFLDLLSSPGVGSSTNPTTSVVHPNVNESPNKGAHDDLLSWLEETPSKQSTIDYPHAISDVQIPVNLNHDDAFSPSQQENDNAMSTPHPTTSASSDAFLDLLSPQPTSMSSPVNTSSDFMVSSSQDTYQLLGERITTSDASAFHTIEGDVSPVVSNDGKNNQAADNFFNDVFGTERYAQQSKVQPSIFDEHTFKTLTEQIEEIVASPFPDIGKLRQLIDEEEHIPQSVRARVLLLLLTGSCVGDDEAQKFVATEVDRRHYSHLVDDCETLVKACGISNIQIGEQMKDIIILYCQRRSADYRNVFSRILLSVYGNRAAVPKPIASSCFYALSSTFLPMIGLQHTPLEHSVDKIHSWIRLLLIYHSPALAQHLDRVVPGWEKPSKEISTAQAARFSSIMKGSSNIDQLEKELGIDLEFEFDSELNHDESEKVTKEKVVQSAPPKRVEGSGLIPSHWVMSFFAGCIPAEESAKLLDWAVFNGERFAGIFLIVALLELHRDYLLQQNAAKLTQWFEDVSTNKTNWFEVGCVSCSQALNWTSFTRGWIHASAALLSGTPLAVRDAINKVESWAIDKTDREAKDITSQLREYYANEKNLDDLLDGKGNEAEEDENMFDEGDDDEDTEEHNSEDPSKESYGDNNGENPDKNKTESVSTESSLFNTALGHLRTLSSKLQTKDDSSVDDLLADLKNSSYVHDRKTSLNTMTLWSSANEVVPSICSNQRRTVSLKGVIPSFQYTVASYKEDFIGTCFFVSKYDSEKPFYFAIDCRSNEEKLLGQFPKAYSLDPDVVTDGDALTNLISVLEPLRSSTHISIIGPGEEYFKWFITERAAKKFTRNSKKETQEINKLVREGENRVNAVAMFLIKKSFQFVSVLDGGFYEAVKFMNRNDSRNTISSSLVDIDKVLLNSMLGIAPPPVATPTGPAKSIIPASVWTETAPNAIKSVGNFISAWSAAAHNAASNQTPGQSQSNPSSTSTEVPAPSSSTTAPISQDSKPLLGGWGKFNLMSSIETIKKNISNVVPPAVAAATTSATSAPPTSSTQQHQDAGHHQSKGNGNNSFVIDEVEDDGMGPRDLPETNKISIVKTDSERAQALAVHRMAGLKKGDSITISRADLPGAVLFPCVKTKEVWVPAPQGIDGEATVIDGHQNEGEAHPGMVKQEQVVSRYLVVSRERFMVLDAHGGGVGSVATVKSNHHLTELIKMTFKKKDPELVTLHLYAADDQTKTRSYRVAKYKDFVTTLQKHMERFK